MFEKEAKEKTIELPCSKDHYYYGFLDGANFGYNKANEWHSIKDKLPPEGKDVLLWFTLPDNSKNDIALGRLENGSFWNLDLDSIIAWQEIVLPQEPKEN